MICTQTVLLQRLEFLNPDDVLADMMRRCPVAQVKKNYSRFAMLPRLATIQEGICRPTHNFSETTNILSGHFEFAGAPLADVLAALAGVDLSGWLYVLLVTADDGMNWYGGIKIDSITAIESGTRITVKTLYRRIIGNAWEVSEIPFEEV